MFTDRLIPLTVVLIAAMMPGQPLLSQAPDGTGGSSYGSSSVSGSSSGSTASAYGGRSTSSHGSSNSAYGGSGNSYGTSRNTYGQSENSYRTSSSRTSPNSSYKTSSSAGVPDRRSYATSSSDYGGSANTYGRNRVTYGTSPNTYGRRGIYRGGSSAYRTDPRQDPNWNNGWAMREEGRWRRPMPVRGRVAGNDGQPIADTVVRLNCGGGSYPMGHTDRRGRFSFNLNSCYPALVVSDARFSGRVGRIRAAPFSSCWIELGAPGYSSRRLGLGAILGPDRNHLGTLVLHAAAAGSATAGPTVSVNTLLAPQDARRAYQRGLRALRKKLPDYQQAVSHLSRAVKIHRPYAPAWTALGEALMATGDQEGAEVAFRAAIEADPKLLAPYESLLQVAYHAKDWNAVESVADSYLKLSPSTGHVWRYRALAAMNLKNMVGLEKFLAKMKDIGEADRWTTAYYLTAQVHTARAEYESAATAYEAFIARNPDHTLATHVKRILYEWSKLEVIQAREFPEGRPVAAVFSPL